ncbi:MAG TPA: hypothetical protein VH475_01335 [Tepidisphaeraceae bacterium]
MNTRILATFLVTFIGSSAFAAAPAVTAIHCPDGGIQPQAAVDPAGRIHLIYLKGDDARSDVMYTTSTDGGRTWAKSIRVNSTPGAAIAVGTVRGAQLAIGQGNRVHVTWMGSDQAEPRGPEGATPMMYARLNDAGDDFEPQRNLITFAPGLDGGGSVAADQAGNVYVAWHAPTPGKKGETNRTVWLAVSHDQGKTFAPETPMPKESTGACGCCGMRLGTDAKGELFALYRAVNPDSRDIYFLTGKHAAGFSASDLQAWPTKTCPMSTASFATAGDRTLAAWETAGQVQFTAIDAATGHSGPILAAPGNGNNRKHPSIAINRDGYVVLAWTEGTGWKRGGSLAWQLYNPQLKPVPASAGTQRGLAVWSLGTAVPTPDGGFAILY